MAGGVTKNESIWIWPFELTEKIGEGGMASVYRARYVKDDRLVAVKILPEEMVAQSAALARFQREMEVLKKLRHPNIVRCFGGVCENKQPFYAMELVEGGTLDDLLQKVGKRTWRTTAECGLQMCAALACAHGQGIVHRDVKPSNFLIDGDTFKLSDFGLAMMTSGTKLTASGKTVGTFDYMAPEQIAGKVVTSRTDLYALGAVFFEMMTGRPPFEAEERVAILHMHLKEPPPRVSDFTVDCPPDFDRLIDDLLEKSPEHRPESAEEVAERLRAILGGESIGLAPKDPRARATVAHGQRMMTEFDEAVAATAPKPVIPKSRPMTVAPESHWPWLVGGLTFLVCVLALFWLSSRERASVGNDALGAWIAATEDDQPRELRAAAAKRLGPLAARSSRAAERLEALLSDPDPFVRTAAVEAFAEAGPAGKDSITELMRLERHEEDASVRRAVVTTLPKVREAPSAGNPWWLRILGLLAFVLAVAGLSLWPRWGARVKVPPKKG